MKAHAYNCLRLFISWVRAAASRTFATAGTRRASESKFTTSMQQERQRGRRGAGADGPVPVVAAQARIAHAHGVPLVVDAAWGAHFGFHPGLPAHALALGADALVTSIHKMLPGYTQASLVLAG